MEDDQLELPECHQIREIISNLTTGTHRVQIKTYVWI